MPVCSKRSCGGGAGPHLLALHSGQRSYGVLEIILLLYYYSVPTVLLLWPPWEIFLHSYEYKIELYLLVLLLPILNYCTLVLFWKEWLWSGLLFLYLGYLGHFPDSVEGPHVVLFWEEWGLPYCTWVTHDIVGGLHVLVGAWCKIQALFSVLSLEPLYQFLSFMLFK